MTKSKFAALTAGLLARKGEAAPSAHSAFMQAVAWAQVAQPHDHPPQKSAAPHDLGALIERAPKAAPPPISAPPDPMPSFAPLTHPTPSPAPEIRPSQIVRGSFPPAPSFGLRGRVPPSAPPAPRAVHAPVAEEAWSAVHRIHRTAVTVRLDEARYLRLKLTGMRYQRTYQDILTRALDAYLTALGIEQVDDRNVESWRARLSRLITR